MDNKILLILTGKEKERLILKKLFSDKVNKVFLCAVEYGAVELVQSLKTAINKEKDIEAELVDFQGKFNSAAFSLKESYLNFIHEIAEKDFIGGANLKKYFAYPFEKFSLWWFSLIFEKNPYKSPAYTLFSKVITILRLKDELKCQKIWLNGGDDILSRIFNGLGLPGGVLSLNAANTGWNRREAAEVFTEILRVTKFILQVLKKAFSVKRLKQPTGYKRYSQAGNVAAVTMFPFVDEEKLKQGQFCNLAYGPLQKAIEQNCKGRVTWLGMFAAVNSSTWPRALKTAEKIKNKETFFVLEEYLGLKDFSRIIAVYTKVSLRALRALNKVKKHFIYHGRAPGFKLNLWQIFKKDFLSSFLGKVLIEGVTNYIEFSNFVKYLPRNSKVFYFAEMHPWEKALNAACAQRKDIICIGIQHTVVPLLLLNYFSHSEDLGEGDYIKYTPNPSYLGCAGPITRDIFLNAGWPEEKLFILGGFRFQSLGSRANASASEVKKKNQIVAAFSISEFENREMLFLLHHAFWGKDIDFDILLKGHPCEPIEKTARKLGLNFKGSRFKFTDKSLEEIIPESKAIVVKESSSVFWAVKSEIPIIVPLFYSISDLCPFSGIEGNPALYIRNSRELFMLAKSIVEGKARIDSKGYSRFMNRYLEIYSDTREYYSNLENIFTDKPKKTAEKLANFN